MTGIAANQYSKANRREQKPYALHWPIITPFVDNMVHFRDAKGATEAAPNMV